MSSTRTNTSGGGLGLASVLGIVFASGGEFVGWVADFEPPKPHECKPPGRLNYATGAHIPKADEGRVWRCECGKAYRCVIEYDQREHDAWTEWRRYARADSDTPASHDAAPGGERG